MAQSDEDRMIEKLEVHRDLVNHVVKLLNDANIKSEPSKDNDPRGDVIILNREDVEKAKTLLKSMDGAKKDEKK